MNRTARLLFPAALGLSAAAHLLVLFLLPYSPAQPARRQAEPIPVRLLEAPRPAPQPLAASRRQAARAEPEPLPAQPEPARPPQPQPVPQTAPQPAVPEEPLELAPPEPSSGGAQKEAAGSEPAATGLPSEAPHPLPAPQSDPEAHPSRPPSTVIICPPPPGAFDFWALPLSLLRRKRCFRDAVTLLGCDRRCQSPFSSPASKTRRRTRIIGLPLRLPEGARRRRTRPRAARTRAAAPRARRCVRSRALPRSLSVLARPRRTRGWRAPRPTDRARRRRRTPRRCDLRHEAPQVAGGRWLVKRAVAAVATPLPSTSCQSSGVREDVAHGAAACALGDDRLERRRLGRLLDHHLAADREADAADALGVDVGTALQEGDRRVDVTLAVPPEGVGVALALALAATVEEQHAVAVAGEHPRPSLRSRPTGERDHGRPVLRRDVPAP